MAASPSISIGDLVRAVGGLAVRDPATIEQIANLLGFHSSADVDLSSAPGVTRPVTTTVTPPPVGGGPPAEIRAENLEKEPTPIPSDLPLRAADLDILTDPTVRRPPRPVPPLEQLLATAEASETAVDTSLLVSRWQRGILTAAIGAHSFDGPIDIARIVEDIANGQAIQRLPRLPIHTTRKGLQVLIDIAEGMRPFAADVARLERLLRLTAGDDGVDVLRFERAPIDSAGRGTRGTWRPYAPPPPGTPVLVVSDFGLARSVLATVPIAWEKVAALLRQQGSPLLALTPFPASRWPGWLTQSMSPIQWDRTTNATGARRAAERAARR